MEKNLIPAPIDNKNLMEDAFEDDNAIFGNFYDARGHRENGKRHMVGLVQVRDEQFPSCINAEGYVEASWNYGGNTVTIKIIGACTNIEDFDETRDIIFEYYKKQFKSWECEDNPGLEVRFGSEDDSLFAHFYFDIDKC